MRLKTIYLVLAVLGVLLPYLHLSPWLIEHGLDVPLFFHDLHSTPVSEFFSADVTVASLVLLVFTFSERKVLGRRCFIPVAALILAGVGFALPLLLYLRETAKEQVSMARAQAP